MKGNIYGVDIKLMPPADDPMPVLIENNGCGYATNFYDYEEGYAYYRRFAQVLGAQAQGKPIFIQGFDREIPKSNELTDRIRKLRAAQSGAHTYSELLDISEMFGPSFEIDTSWVKDDYDSNISRIDNPTFDPEESYHQQAAREENVPLMVFDEINYLYDCLEFKLMNGSKRRFLPEQIGMIYSAYELSHAPKKYQHLFLSSQFIEGIADNKAFAELVEQLTEDKRYISTASLIFGLGIDERDKLLKFLNDESFITWVKKPVGLSGGIGVEIYGKNDVLKFIDKFNSVSGMEENKLLDSMSSLIFACDLGCGFENYLSIIQPFVYSVPILNKKTGKNHDACARTVVYSPPDSDPIVLGSQWRLSPSPLGDKEASPEDMLRANLSRGAIAVPIEPKYLKIINDFAVGYIKQFETTLWQLQNREYVLPKVREAFKIRYNAKDHEAPDLVVFRHLFWWIHMLHKAEREGIKAENFHRGIEERIKKKRYEITKQMSLASDQNLFDLD